MTYSPNEVRAKVKALACRFDKAVDAILWNETQKTMTVLNKMQNVQEDILRTLEAKLMTMHQGDNQEPSK